MKSLIIIPAYNEQENIIKVIDEIEKTATQFDYIIVNDCSTDLTSTMLAKRKCIVINLPINLGIGGAVQTGYKYAFEKGYDYAVQVDGDGQHNPHYLEIMLNQMIEEKADMVIGSRFINKKGFQSSGIRRIGIKYFTRLIRFLTGVAITDPTSGLRLVNKKCIELFARYYPKDYPEPESIVMLLKKKMKVVEVPVIMRERTGGISSISALKSIYYMIKVTIAILMEKLR